MNEETPRSLSQNDASVPSPALIVGAKVALNPEGKFGEAEWKALAERLSMYSDKRYETARYFFVKDGAIVRQVAVSSQTPSATLAFPDEGYHWKLREWALESGAKIVFCHNHPSGYTAPSEADERLTSRLSNFFNGDGEEVFLGHVILDHGSFGLYTPGAGWKYFGPRGLEEFGKDEGGFFIRNWVPDLSRKVNYFPVANERGLLLLAEKARELDALDSWNSKDWVPAILASKGGEIRSMEYANAAEFKAPDLLLSRMKEAGRLHGAGDLYLFPANWDQAMLCRSFAAETNAVRGVCRLSEGGEPDVSFYANAELFGTPKKSEIIVEDTEKMPEAKARLETMKENERMERTEEVKNAVKLSKIASVARGNGIPANGDLIESVVDGTRYRAEYYVDAQPGASPELCLAADALIERYVGGEWEIVEFPKTEEGDKAFNELLAKMTPALIDDTLAASKEQQKLNFVLDKLSKAGIEVVTDKTEFDRILEQEKLVQKMAVSLSELNELSSSIKNQKAKIDEEKEKASDIAKTEGKVNDYSFKSFVAEMQKYQDIFPNDEFIKISNLNYEKHPSTNFELFIGKDSWNEHLVLSLNCNTPGYKHDFHSMSFFDITSNKSIINSNLEHIGYGGFPFREIASSCLNETKELLSQKDYISQIQDKLKEILESLQIRQSDILDNLIKENMSRRESLEGKIDKIKELEKTEARKTIDSWLYEAEEKAADLWNKDQYEVQEYFKGNDERKSIGIIPENCMSIFDDVEDYHLYADKSYLIDHYINRHYDNRLFENIQNVLDNYSNIYFDKEQKSIGFIKKYGELADCLFVKNDNGKIVLFATTYNQPEYRLHNKRYEKITPAKEREQKLSLEGSTPLSQNPEGNTAVAISDVSDDSSIAQQEKKSSEKKQKFVRENEVYGFAHVGKIYLNPDVMTSEAAVHEYTHLWDAYTQRMNPELWKKGMDVFKGTNFWNDVKADPNYGDIAVDDDLILSEVHARICGKMADEILSKIAERDGELKKDAAIDWDKEVTEFVAKEFGGAPELGQEDYLSETVRAELLKEFLSSPMKDLMSGLQITKGRETSGQAKEETVETEEDKLMAKKKEKAPARRKAKKPEETAVAPEAKAEAAPGREGFKDEEASVEELYADFVEKMRDGWASMKEKEEQGEEPEYASFAALFEGVGKSYSKADRVAISRRVAELAGTESPAQASEWLEKEISSEPVRESGKETPAEGLEEPAPAVQEGAAPVPEQEEELGVDALKKLLLEAQLRNDALNAKVSSLESVIKGLQSQLAQLNAKLGASQGREEPSPVQENASAAESGYGAPAQGQQAPSPDPNQFSTQTMYRPGIPVPKFGVKVGEDEFDIKEGCRFKELLKNKDNPAMNEVVLERETEDGTIEKVKISEREYTRIASVHEKFEREKSQYAGDSYEWDYFHKKYGEEMGVDRNRTRMNTAANFLHNFKVWCRASAENPQDAMRIARDLVNGMNEWEKRRFNLMRNQWPAGGEDYDKMLVHVFEENSKLKGAAITADRRPGGPAEASMIYELNKDDIQLKKGELIPGTNKRVGETVKLAMKFTSLEGRTVATPQMTFEIVGCSKNLGERNTIILANREKNTRYEVPLDPVREKIIELEKSQKKELKREAAKAKKNALSLSENFESERKAQADVSAAYGGRGM